MEMTRRDFMTAAAAAVATSGLVVEAASASTEVSPAATPMTDAEAWEWLMDEPEITEDFVMEDGVVVPAIYLRMWNRINRTGSGCGNLHYHAHRDPYRYTFNFDWLMESFTEEEAEAYMMMPYLQWFQAADLPLDVRTEAEWDEICEDLSLRGLMYRVRRAGIAYYHQLAFVHGLFEFAMNHYEEEDYLWKLFGLTGHDLAIHQASTGTYHPVPVNADVVGDAHVLPYDDLDAIVARNTVFAVADCQCRRYEKLLGAIGDECTHPMETCIAFGECAEYYIENGIGREIDRDECAAILQRSIDCGMVIQSEWTHGNEVICSCHGDCCGQLRTIIATDGDLPTFEHYGNYKIVVDNDTCIQCGSCIARCPMFTISFGEDGYTQLGNVCVGCGQCATVCPVGARKLYAKPVEDQCTLAIDMLGDYVQKSLERAKKGLIEDFHGAEDIEPME